MRIRILKLAQTEAEHGHAERKKETEKHHGIACLRIDLMFVQKFLKLIIYWKVDMAASGMHVFHPMEKSTSAPAMEIMTRLLS